MATSKGADPVGIIRRRLSPSLRQI